MKKANSIELEWNRVPIWDTTFKIAEAPMSCFNNLQNKYLRNASNPEFINLMASFRKDAVQLFKGLRHRNLRVIKDSFLGLKDDTKRCFIYTFKNLQCISICLGTALAFPISIALTPITIIADIFAGVIQASMRLSQGADKKEILSILHKKVIASPVQQGTYLLISATGLGVFTGAAFFKLFWGWLSPVPTLTTTALVISALMGDQLYCSSQRYVAQLPRFFRPDGYNVFIGDGAVDRWGNKVDFDPETTYLKWRREYEAQQARESLFERDRKTENSPPKYEEYKRTYSASARDYAFPSGTYRSTSADKARQAFSSTRSKVQVDLNELAAQSCKKFKNIRSWFKNNEDTYTLFGFSSSDEVTIEQLKKKYRALSLQCHPDRVCDNDKEEATIWFKLLNEARLNVEINILGLNHDVNLE